jgi:nucleotide-binding universal stress UspA family protein
MLKKILIAIDGSDGSFKAAAYAGEQFSDVSNLQITLLHVIPYPPAPLWDDGHIPTKTEKEQKQKAIEKWTQDQHEAAGPMFDKAIAILVGKGIERGALSAKTISDSSDIAGSILEETRNGGYRTLIAGRRGITALKGMLAGSVTTKLVSHGSGLAVCVVC